MTTKELLEKFTREEGIALFNTKKTDKEIYDVLVSKGLTDDYETFCSEAQKIFSEKVSKMSKEEILAQIEGAELTDEQLAQIAGGKSDSDIANIVGLAGGIGFGVGAAVLSGLAVGAAVGSASAAAAF